jgi:hypothetical protein
MDKRRAVQVFIRRDGDQVIVVPMHYNENGVRYEDETTVRIEGPFDPSEIGTAVFLALGTSGVRPKNLRETKLTDWPAFRASGATSVRRFEADYIALKVEGANDANLVFTITGLPFKGSELEVGATAPNACSSENLGDVVGKVYRACRDRTI